MQQTLSPNPAARRRLLRAMGATAATLATAPMAWAQVQDEFGRAPLKGAGSTFVYPLMVQWIKENRAHTAGADFKAGNAGLDGDLLGAQVLDYEPVGSLAGLQRLRAKAVDFALSELPLSARTLKDQGLIQLPVVLGSVAIVANLPGLQQPLRLDGATVAAVYLGQIKKWNDPALLALNPGAALPDADIQPLVRTEGSGTTYTVTSFLATQVPTWRDVVGVDAVVSWPMGHGVRGSSGMAQALRSTPFSLGYLDAVQAQATGLDLAALKNRAGAFVTPSAASVAAAAQSADWQGWQQRKDGDSLPLINAQGAGSYPVIASVLAVLPHATRTRAHLRARTFLQWALQNGQPVAQRLGYVPLPASAAQQVRAALSAKT